MKYIQSLLSQIGEVAPDSLSHPANPNPNPNPNSDFAKGVGTVATTVAALYAAKMAFEQGYLSKAGTYLGIVEEAHVTHQLQSPSPNDSQKINQENSVSNCSDNKNESLQKLKALCGKYTDLVNSQNSYIDFVSDQISGLNDDLTKVGEAQQRLLRLTEQTPEKLNSQTKGSEGGPPALDLPYDLMMVEMESYPTLVGIPTQERLTSLINERKAHHNNVEKLVRAYLGTEYSVVEKFKQKQLKHERIVDTQVVAEETRMGIPKA